MTGVDELASHQHHQLQSMRWRALGSQVSDGSCWQPPNQLLTWLSSRRVSPWPVGYRTGAAPKRSSVSNFALWIGRRVCDIVPALACLTNSTAIVVGFIVIAAAALLVVLVWAFRR